MKKRIGALLLAGVMALSMTGCGSNNKAKTYSKYVKLGEYKGIEYSLDIVDVTDDDVDARVDEFVQGLTTTEDVTGRAVKDGDTVNIDFVGKKDGEPFEGGTSEGYELVIGSGSFIEGFEEGLIGHEIGEKVSLDLTFPEDYQAEDLAGQAVVFDVTINSISVEKVPNLSDDLVAENTEYKTIQEFKDATRKEIEEENTKAAEQQAKTEVFNKVVENAEITGYDQKEVEKLIDKEFDSFKETAESYEAYGYSYEDVLASNGYSSEDELKDGITEYVKNYLNQVMVLYCIADKEKIKVSSDEVDNMVKEYMETYSVETKEEVYDYFGEDYFEISILSEKVMDFLMENAKKVDAASTEAPEMDLEGIPKDTEEVSEDTEKAVEEKADDDSDEKEANEDGAEDDEAEDAEEEAE